MESPPNTDKKVKFGTETMIKSMVRVTLPLSCVHINSCSSYNQMVDPESLNNIHETPTVLRGDYNLGSSITNKKGSLSHILEF